jgi:hypothetical protein
MKKHSFKRKTSIFLMIVKYKHEYFYKVVYKDDACTTNYLTKTTQ